MASDKDDLVPDGREHELIEGAAEDSAASEDELAKLPRLLRYAVLAARGVTSASWSVAAEIVEISPDLSEAYAWCLIPESATGIGLAAVLDHRAVAQDRSEMRWRIASGCSPCRCHGTRTSSATIAAWRALLASLRKLDDDVPPDLAAEAEAVTYGWSALPLCCDDLTRAYAIPAATAAADLGDRMARYRITEAEAKLQRLVRRTQAEPGSVRQLRRIVEVIMRERDRLSPRN